ncbi:MAG: hypothetical protein HGB22_01435 [Chlorobiaceae bacterium]|nr:hypothetical protein [Chlorobiaceae bacterium]
MKAAQEGNHILCGLRKKALRFPTASAISTICPSDYLQLTQTANTISGGCARQE